MKRQKITEEILAKCDLSKEEEKVLRHYYDLPLNMRNTEWAENLGGPKYGAYFESGQKKLVQALRTQRAEK